MTPHGRSPRRRAVLATAVATLLLVGSASSVLADPSNPTDRDVRDARRAVAGAQSSVAAIELRLAQQSVERDAAEAAVQRAGEAYTQAEHDRSVAAETATTTAARAEVADQEAEESRRQLVAIARSSARSGGSMNSIEAMLTADGFEQVVERSTSMSRASATADRAVQRYKAAQLVATTLKDRAGQAVTDQEEATRLAKEALASAEELQAETDRALVAAAAERDELITQLAAARSTSAEVERARQDRIDADRLARADAAAQAVRQPVNAPTAPTGGATGPVGTAPAPPPAAGTPATPTTPPAAAPVAPVPAPAPVAPAPAPAPTTPATTPPVTSPAPGLGAGRSRGTAAQGEAAVAWATARVGLPYLYGGAGPDAFDCSGLTMRAWQNAGVAINRTSRDQYTQVLKISYDDMRPGDLVFWTDVPGVASEIRHVAMWLGGGKIMEAPRAGVPLRITTMRWAETMPYAGRV